MITQIGIIAGEIWHYLDVNGKVKLSCLFTDLGADDYLILMSLGWLAREGHVIMNDDPADIHDFQVWLSEEEV